MKKTLDDRDYRALAEFRYHIRRFLEFSDRAVRAMGMEPKQYQLLLAIRGLPPDVEPTVGSLAERLRLRHHSAVELVNRAERRNLVQRSRLGTRVLVHLTDTGRDILAQAVEVRLQELRVAAPVLVDALQELMDSSGQATKKGPRKARRQARPAAPGR